MEHENIHVHKNTRGKKSHNDSIQQERHRTKNGQSTISRIWKGENARNHKVGYTQKKPKNEKNQIVIVDRERL